MKKNDNKTFKKTKITKPSTPILIIYNTIAIFFILIVALSIPPLLNYGPEFINSEFDVLMSGIPYYQQILIILLLILSMTTFFLKINFKDIDSWFSLPPEERLKDPDKINLIRKKCVTLPLRLLSIQIILPIVISTLVLFSTNNHGINMVFKIYALVISSAMLLAVISYIFSKKIYTKILTLTYIEGASLGNRLPLMKQLFIQLLPIFMTVILIFSLIAYNRSVSSQENIYFKHYSNMLNSEFNTDKVYTKSEIIDKLNKMQLIDSTTNKWFIIKPNGEYITSDKSTLSNFLITYTSTIAPKYEGRTYDSYGIDTQGSSKPVNCTDGIYHIGYLYNTNDITVFAYIIIGTIFLFILTIISIYILSRSISKDLTHVLMGLQNISKNKHNTKLSEKLPVTSNDEIGDLVQEFNNIQTITNNYISEIEKNQDILIEQERLASLGQMIGGIAHNLKTPIMSIGGAAEGINDLISEYKLSIKDKEVTIEDHEQIANDMADWVNKIKTHISYMSDIITAVKGQAVTLSQSNEITFSMEELGKRIDILMKHELKNAIIYLNISNNVKNSVHLKGNINGLVQVVNNIISNAIQAYNGKTEQNIDLIFNKVDNKIIIAIRDYAGGIPKDIQEKLFNSMITTKGKNGTGLGLFMSYSNIKAHFSGTITFETKENEGTTFYITLPINREKK